MKPRTKAKKHPTDIHTAADANKIVIDTCKKIEAILIEATKNEGPGTRWLMMARILNYVYRGFFRIGLIEAERQIAKAEESIRS